jgi:hypothetical protein
MINTHQNNQLMYNLNLMYHWDEMLLLRIYFRSRMLNMAIEDYSFVIHHTHIHMYKTSNEYDPSII